MRIPRDIKGKELVKFFKKYGYEITRQTGSHIRLTTHINGIHHITIPKHNVLKVGTLNSILKDVAEHFKFEKEILIKELNRNFPNFK